MKKLIRSVIFSAVAIFLTSLWNKGFIIKYQWKELIIFIIIISIINYIIIPLSKLILLPLNIITFGLVSTLVYFFIFYFVVSKFPVIQIKTWQFPGISFAGIVIKSFNISYLANVILSSISIASFINLLEKFL